MVTASNWASLDVGLDFHRNLLSSSSYLATIRNEAVTISAENPSGLV